MPRIVRRVCLSGAAAGFAGLLAGACGPLDARREQAKGLGPRGLGKEPTQISFMTDWAAGERGRIIEEAARIWAQKQPTVKVDLQIVRDANARDALMAGFAAGTPPDVSLNSESFVAKFRENFVNLMPFIKRDKFDMNDWVPMHPNFLYQGGRYAMPFQFNLSGWWYNADMFQREGVSPPTERWTWNDMTDATRRMTRRDQQQWGLEDARGLDDLLDTMLPSNGGEFINADFTKTMLNTPQAIDTVRWIVERVHRDRTFIAADERRTVIPPGMTNAWQVGRVAIVYVNLSVLQTVQAGDGAPRFNWDLMLGPKAPRTGRAKYQAVHSPHTLSKREARTAAQTEAAWAFITFMSGPDVMALIAEGRGSTPVHKKVLLGERYLRTPPPSMRLMREIAENANFARPWFPGFDDWWGVVRPHVMNALQGKVAPDDALRAATDQGDAILRQLTAARKR